MRKMLETVVRTYEIKIPWDGSPADKERVQVRTSHTTPRLSGEKILGQLSLNYSALDKITCDIGIGHWCFIFSVRPAVEL